MSKLMLLTFVVLSFSHSHINASPIVIGQGAFSPTATVITFDSIPDNQEVTTQYSGMGITFSGGLFSSFGVALNTGPSGTCDMCNDVTVDFNQKILRLGFDATTNPPDDLMITLYQVVNGSFVQSGSFVFDTGLFFTTFVGLEDSTAGINRAVISGVGPANHAFVLYNLRFENKASAVPEPATILLLSTGIIGIIARNHRRFE